MANHHPWLELWDRNTNEKYFSVQIYVHPSIVHGSGARGMRAFSNWIHQLCRRISFCGGDGEGGEEGSSLFLELVLGA